MITLSAAVLLCGSLFAGIDETQKTECAEGSIECPTAKKVNSLLSSWDVAAKEAATATPEAREAFGKHAAEVAGKCPVGSRMGKALSTANDVLAFVVASSEANAKHCPIEKMDDGSEACAAAKEMKSFRTHAMTSLSQLANYTAGATCAEGECADACDETACDKMATSCPIKLASRVGVMKASFEDAKREALALTPEAKNEILTGFGKLGKSSKMVALVPESVAALAEGLDKLNQLHAEMSEWAKANPEMLAEVPESTHLSFMMEVSLVDEARELVQSVADAMQIMQPKVAGKAAMEASSTKG